MHRRSVLLSGITGVSAFAVGRTSLAQDVMPAPLATHPLTGVWLAMANPPLPDDPQYPAPSLLADGTVVLMVPPVQKGPQGVQFSSDMVGIWEADSDRRGHFTTVQILTAADGTLLGSVTVDGYPEVSEDGQTFIDDGSRVTVTIRDPLGTIVEEFPGVGGRAVTGIRMAPGAPGSPTGLPAGTPIAGTPVAGTPTPFATPAADAMSPTILRAGRPGRARPGRGRRRRRRRDQGRARLS
jgi:hypothetical protein